jgi:hypothetical protein
MVDQYQRVIDIGTLRSLYQSSPVAKAALDHFAAREKRRWETTVERLQGIVRQELTDVSRGDIIEIFRMLESANCGRFVVGRRGHLSRFEWSSNLIAVGKAAAGEPMSAEEMAGDDGDPVLEEDDDERFTVSHHFRLRPDLEISLCLPPDLTTQEASRIADFVRTLPF